MGGGDKTATWNENEALFDRILPVEFALYCTWLEEYNANRGIS